MSKTTIVKDKVKNFNLKHFAKSVEVGENVSVKKGDIIYNDLVFNDGKNKIAFLFLTIGNLKKGDIWYDFFKKNDNKVSIYSHIKNPSLVNQGFLLNSDIKVKSDTRWGDVSLIVATNNLLTEALKDPNNEYFILLSESTIPLYDLNEVYHRITSLNTSAISYSLPKTPENLRRKNSVTDLKFSKFYKQSQWMVLKRDHVKFILENDYVKYFKNAIVPDENYYINVFKKFYKNFDSENTNIVTTHVDWSINGLHPKTFDEVDINDFTHINNGPLFLRKVGEKTLIKPKVNYENIVKDIKSNLIRTPLINEKPIMVFYHIFCSNHWKIIIKDQMGLIKSSGLFKVCSKIFLIINGDDESYKYIVDNYGDDKIEFLKADDKYEYPTLELIRNISIKNDFRGLYLHTKSASKEFIDGSYYWGKVMNFYNINLWEQNYTKLNNYDIIGCNFKKGNISTKKYWDGYSNNLSFLDAYYHTDHFSGNFWWFNSDYSKNLRKLSFAEKNNRFNAEWYIFMNNPKYFNWPSPPTISYDMTENQYNKFNELVIKKIENDI
jgi:hypothetical protein